VPTADLRLDDARVSGDHAVIHYSAGRWEVRDLGSTNGTWVNKSRLHKGDRTILTAGALLMFGGRELTFELKDASAPVACARHMRTGEMCLAADGVLELPNDTHPLLQIYEGLDGRWLIDSQNEHRYVADRDVVIVDGEGWSLELPDSSAATLDTARLGPFIEAVTLRFHLSLDEEHIELTLAHDTGEMHLGTRQYHLPLLLLARAWLADAASSPEERGWVERDTLCRGLSVDANKLNVDIYRARKQLFALGVLGAANVVVRRIDTGHLRLGVLNVEIWKGGVLEVPPPRTSPQDLPPKADPSSAPVTASPEVLVAVSTPAHPDTPEGVKDTVPDETSRDTAPDALEGSKPPEG